MFREELVRAIAVLLTALTGALPAIAQEPRAYLELFTSQGCAACPPADRLIADLTEEDDVLAVTMPVQLWDFLGWSDTLANKALTERQIAYSVVRGDRDVYTPQVVVNGTRAVVGGDTEAVEAAIDRAKPLALPVYLKVSDGVLSVRLGRADVEADHADIHLLVIDEEITVPVRGGENRGRKLSYVNVVRRMRPIGMWKGKPMSLDLPLSDVERREGIGCVVIVQERTAQGPGRILGAAKVNRLFPARSATER